MKSAMVRFTATQLEALRPGTKQRDITDPGTRGLVLRIEPNGTKSWLFRYKWAKEPIRLALGFFPTLSLHDARKEALEYRELLRQRIDPRKAGLGNRGVLRAKAAAHAPDSATAIIRHPGIGGGEAASQKTEDRDDIDELLESESVVLDKYSFEFLVREFYRRYITPNRKNPGYVKRILKTELLPRWRARDARTIKPREVVEALDVVVDRGSLVMANRVAATMAQLFMFGIQRAIVDDSPVKLLFKPGGKEKPRKRALAENELIMFIQNIDKACRSRRKARVLMVLLLTLQRRGELGLAEWKEFDFNARLWRIPNGHAKGGRGHVLPLTDWAVEELKVLKRMSGTSRFVLPNGGKGEAADSKLITRSVARSLKRFKKLGVQAFTAHDLRRTGRTGLARLGVSKDHAERVLNHAREAMESTYDVHEYIDEKRAALEKWENYLRDLRAKVQPREVLPLSGDNPRGNELTPRKDDRSCRGKAGRQPINTAINSSPHGH